MSIEGLSGLDLIKQDKNPAISVLDGNTGVSGADKAKKSLADDFDNFMLLLTTQLKNQDPTQPLDTNQFTQQLVAFTGVEQAIATNKNLETLIARTKTNQLNNAVSYIGKTVEATGNKGVLGDGLAVFTYNLPAGAAKTTVTITDSAGRAVFSGAGSVKEGKNVVYWDGKNSFNGATESNGIYTITVTAKDAQQNALEVDTYTTGMVTAVEIDGEEMILSLGNLKIKLDDVLAIRETPVAVAPPAGDDDEAPDEEVDSGSNTETEGTDDTAADGADTADEPAGDEQG